MTPAYVSLGNALALVTLTYRVRMTGRAGILCVFLHLWEFLVPTTRRVWGGIATIITAVRRVAQAMLHVGNGPAKTSNAAPNLVILQLALMVRPSKSVR